MTGAPVARPAVVVRKGDVASAFPIRQYSGSLTKEPPLDLLDKTILLIEPGMAYSKLLSLAETHTNAAVPGLLRARFLLLEGDHIIYDRFLSLAHNEGPSSRRVRKVMFLLWALRDGRLRGFILDKVVDAKGKWRVSELTRKANADYFTQWHHAGSAAKVRSNIEYFLSESGVYRPSTRDIHLETKDGWLPEAIMAAAQHAADRNAEADILRDPVGFLFDNALHGLANLTAAEREAASKGQPVAVELLDDELAAAWAAEPSATRDWVPHVIKAGPSSRIAAIVDPVALERANAAHQALEQLVADAAIASGLQPRCTVNVDMLLETEHGHVLLEMKSCTQRNYHGQIRRAISQLLEYRFIYREGLGEDATLAIVAETAPPQSKFWLIDYLSSLGIILMWRKRGERRLVTTLSVPQSLEGIAVRV